MGSGLRAAIMGVVQAVEYTGEIGDSRCYAYQDKSRKKTIREPERRMAEGAKTPNSYRKTGERVGSATSDSFPKDKTPGFG